MDMSYKEKSGKSYVGYFFVGQDNIPKKEGISLQVYHERIPREGYPNRKIAKAFDLLSMDEPIEGPGIPLLPNGIQVRTIGNDFYAWKISKKSLSGDYEMIYANLNAEQTMDCMKKLLMSALFESTTGADINESLMWKMASETDVSEELDRRIVSQILNEPLLKKLCSAT